jgi:hypothetical protein
MFRYVCIVMCLFALVAAPAHAQTMSVGSGPYAAIVEGDPGAPDHTIYRPKDLSAFNKNNPMPVLAWGNGGCSASSQMHANFLAEVASHGFLVIALGPYKAPGGGGATGGGGMMGGMGGGTKSAQMLEAIDWATKENKNKESKYYEKVDPLKFAVAGMSCGGLQALEVSTDERVKTTMVMDSGLLGTSGGAPGAGAPGAGAPGGGMMRGGAPGAGAPGTGAPGGGMMRGGGAPGGGMAGMPALGKEHLQKLHAPVIYIEGGPSDIAYQNGLDDYAKIEKVPVAFTSYDDVGHGGTYSQPNGGEFGKVASAWLKWQLKGDQTAKKMFSGKDCGLCKEGKWKFDKKKID